MNLPNTPSPDSKGANGPFFYVYAITFDQDTFGVYATRAEAEESLREQIAGHGPAWDDCQVTRWRIWGVPERSWGVETGP